MTLGLRDITVIHGGHMVRPPGMEPMMPPGAHTRRYDDLVIPTTTTPSTPTTILATTIPLGTPSPAANYVRDVNIDAQAHIHIIAYIIGFFRNGRVVLTLRAASHQPIRLRPRAASSHQPIRLRPRAASHQPIRVRSRSPRHLA